MLENEEWQIDMIQILKGSQFDGYFEYVAERIKAVLTPETRRTIQELKYLTPDNEHIIGIEYYQAEISDNVRNLSVIYPMAEKSSGNWHCFMVSLIFAVKVCPMDNIDK